MPKRPHALLFDLGNVCLPFDHGRMVEQIADLFGVEPEAVHEAVLTGTTFTEIERGDISEAAMHRMLCDRFGREVAADDLFEAASDIFTPDEAMNDLLAELAGTDFPLILVSNTNGPHIRFVEQSFDVLDHFDECILSFEIGAAKPELAFFEAAFAAANCSPGDCFYTDDIAAYIDAARGHGVDSELFQNAAELRRQLELRDVL